MFRAFADVQTAEMLEPAAARAWKAASPSSSPARCRRSSTPSSRSWWHATTGCGRRRSTRGTTTPWPSPPTAASSPLDARMLSADGPGLPGLEGQRPGRERRRHLAAHRRDTRHADDLLRHGRPSDALGLLGLRRHHRQAGRPRHPPRADRRHRRRRHRRQETGPLREGPQRPGPRAARQHAEDGHRHQRAETPGRAASPRCPLEAGRGRAARGPHPPPGQRERGSGDLPLRHRRLVRRLHVAGAGNQGPVHRPGHDRRQRRPPRRGHRRPGTLLRRGQGDCLGQPRRADPRRGRRRAATAHHPRRRTTPTSSTSPAAACAICRAPSPACRSVANLTTDQATATAHAADPITIGDRRYAHARTCSKPPGQAAWTPCRTRSTRPALSPSASIAACASASCSTRTVPRTCTSKGPPRARPRFPATPRTACRPERPRPPGRRLRAQTATARQDLAIAEGQLRDYQARLGKPFPHDAYLSELTSLRDQLKAGLSEAARAAVTPARRGGRAANPGAQGGSCC